MPYLETTETLDDGRRMRRFREIPDVAEAEREARQRHEEAPEVAIRVWSEPGVCWLVLGPPDGSRP
jgi:hypothetical protein